MEFKKEISIDCDKVKLWELVTDLGRVPEFWHGTRSIENKGSYYEVQFAFPGKGKMKPVLDREKFVMEEIYSGGPFKGTKITKLVGDSPVKLISEWNIKLSIMLRPMGSKLQEHFESGTENALERMKSYLES